MAYVPDSDKQPLRIAGLSKHWEPTRIPTPRFIDAWTTNENAGLVGRLVPVILDSTCENVVVWRTEDMSERDRSDLHVQQGEISFCRVFAKSGSGREDEALEPEEDNDD